MSQVCSIKISTNPQQRKHLNWTLVVLNIVCIHAAKLLGSHVFVFKSHNFFYLILARRSLAFSLFLKCILRIGKVMCMWRNLKGLNGWMDIWSFPAFILVLKILIEYSKQNFSLNDKKMGKMRKHAYVWKPANRNYESHASSYRRCNMDGWHKCICMQDDLHLTSLCYECNCPVLKIETTGLMPP